MGPNMLGAGCEESTLFEEGRESCAGRWGVAAVFMGKSPGELGSSTIGTASCQETYEVHHVLPLPHDFEQAHSQVFLPSVTVLEGSVSRGIHIAAGNEPIKKTRSLCSVGTDREPSLTASIFHFPQAKCELPWTDRNSCFGLPGLLDCFLKQMLQRCCGQRTPWGVPKFPC